MFEYMVNIAVNIIQWLYTTGTECQSLYEMLH